MDDVNEEVKAMLKQAPPQGLLKPLLFCAGITALGFCIGYTSHSEEPAPSAMMGDKCKAICAKVQGFNEVEQSCQCQEER